MRKYITFVFVLIFVAPIYAQELGKKIEKRKAELHNSEIDTLILYHVNCDNDIQSFTNNNDSCSIIQTYFLFWIKNGVYYKQEINNCSILQEEKINQSNFIKTVLNNISSIQKAEIKPIEHYVKDKKGNLENDEIIILETNHTCTTIFEFNFSETHFTKSIRQFELETKMLDKKTTNDNYEYNQKSILTTIKNLVEKEK